LFDLLALIHRLPTDNFVAAYEVLDIDVLAVKF